MIYNTEKYGTITCKEELAFSEIATIVNAVKNIDDACLAYMTTDLYLLKILTDLEIEDELNLEKYDELFSDGITEIVHSDSIKNLDLLYRLISESKKIENQIGSFLDRFADALEKVSKKMPSKKKMEEIALSVVNIQGQKNDN